MHHLLQTFRKSSNFIPDCCKIGDNKFLRNNKKHSETAEKPSLLFVFVNFILLSRRNFKVPSKTLSCTVQRSVKKRINVNKIYNPAIERRIIFKKGINKIYLIWHK